MRNGLSPDKNNGFTLVELSIVLVILGLITAGVVGGQTLVAKAKFKTVVADITKFDTAATTFKTQYASLPGDMPNATAYWGTGATGICQNGLAPTGCNGNGNGLIDEAIGESWRFWQHLALSGYISGTYSGVVSSGTFQPTSKVNSGTYRALAITSSNPLYGRTGNVITLDSNTGGLGYSGVVTAEDASYAIDLKMDDGVADKGNVYATTPHNVAGSATECTTGSWVPLSASGSYNLTIKGKYCRMIFWF